jgi:hypothetical protein
MQKDYEASQKLLQSQAMLIGYASHPAAQISNTDQIGIRIRYDSDTYRICHMTYQIIFFNLTSIQILTNKFGPDTFQI